MRLASITVEKYRSITSARKIQLQDQTILVGPNNEGKSNILRALVTGMSMLTSGIREARVGPRGPRPVIRYSTRHPYDWTYDFPVHLQERQPNGQSVIVLEFEPTPNELAEFREEIKSRLSGTIPLRLTFGPRDVSVTVSKQGRGNTTLSRKSPQIASFVARRLDFEHIPAVRTAQSAQEIVSDLVDRELRELESNDEYTEALKRIEDLQQPILDHLSASIQNTLVQFLPKVVSVKV